MQTKWIDLRAARTEDDPFLYELYATTRADEMARVDWTPVQKELFLHMQFNAQRYSYSALFPEARHQVILQNDRLIGRIMTHQSAEELLLVDIALLPEYRRHGIGTGLIQALQAEALEAGLPVHLHVETFNPAQFLYERLSFKKVRLDGIYFSMEWQPTLNISQDSRPLFALMEK